MTIYNMKEKFGTDINNVDEEMLNKIKHVPAIIIRE